MLPQDKRWPDGAEYRDGGPGRGVSINETLDWNSQVTVDMQRQAADALDAVITHNEWQGA